MQERNPHEVAAPREPPVLSVFLCHASDDKPAVHKLYEWLNSSQFKLWFDEPKAYLLAFVSLSTEFEQEGFDLLMAQITRDFPDGVYPTWLNTELDDLSARRPTAGVRKQIDQAAQVAAKSATKPPSSSKPKLPSRSQASTPHEQAALQAAIDKALNAEQRNDTPPPEKPRDLWDVQDSKDGGTTWTLSVRLSSRGHDQRGRPTLHIHEINLQFALGRGKHRGRKGKKN